MTVRAKFCVTTISQVSWNTTVREITLEPRYDESIPEDERFSRYTPSGKLTMTVTNPAVIEALKIGQFYYLELFPAANVVG